MTEIVEISKASGEQLSPAPDENSVSVNNASSCQFIEHRTVTGICNLTRFLAIGTVTLRRAAECKPSRQEDRKEDRKIRQVHGRSFGVSMTRDFIEQGFRNPTAHRTDKSPFTLQDIVRNAFETRPHDAFRLFGRRRAFCFCAMRIGI